MKRDTFDRVHTALMVGIPVLMVVVIVAYAVIAIFVGGEILDASKQEGGLGRAIGGFAGEVTKGFEETRKP